MCGRTCVCAFLQREKQNDWPSLCAAWRQNLKPFGSSDESSLKLLAETWICWQRDRETVEHKQQLVWDSSEKVAQVPCVTGLNLKTASVNYKANKWCVNAVSILTMFTLVCALVSFNPATLNSTNASEHRFLQSDSLNCTDLFAVCCHQHFSKSQTNPTAAIVILSNRK